MRRTLKTVALTGAVATLAVALLGTSAQACHGKKKCKHGGGKMVVVSSIPTAPRLLWRRRYGAVAYGCYGGGYAPTSYAGSHVDHSGYAGATTHGGYAGQSYGGPSYCWLRRPSYGGPSYGGYAGQSYGGPGYGYGGPGYMQQGDGGFRQGFGQGLVGGALGYGGPGYGGYGGPGYGGATAGRATATAATAGRATAGRAMVATAGRAVSLKVWDRVSATRSVAVCSANNSNTTRLVQGWPAGRRANADSRVRAGHGQHSRDSGRNRVLPTPCEGPTRKCRSATRSGSRMSGSLAVHDSIRNARLSSSQKP